MKRLAMLFTIAILLAAFPLLAAAEDQNFEAIYINEVLASCSNKVFQDEKGNAPDWIEIYNACDHAVNLKGLCLSDSAAKLDKFVFPDVTLPADGYLLVLCSGEDRVTATELHTSFKLSSDGETVLLSWQGRVLDQMNTGRTAKDVSAARNAEGKWEKTHAPTPGSKNRITGLTENKTPENAPYTRGMVQINEVMASASPFRNLSGYDYVELYNAGKYVNLSNWSISLSGKENNVYTFPRGTAMGRGDYLVIYFTAEENAQLATGFSISASYGTLTLKNDKGEVVDVLSWSEPLYGNLPYGRPANSSAVCYLEKETRGAKNPSAGYAARAEKPEISQAAGFYSDALTVELTAGAGETIYYTTDGSTPSRKSAKYTAPISVKKTTVLRAVAASDTAMLSEIAAATYFIGMDMDVPVVSVMIDDDYLNGSSNGMMAPNNYKKDWEYPANVEYFDPDGTRKLDQLAGVAVSGATSRMYTQKSMVFFARKAYGKESFPFNPFPHRDYDSVKAFVLRNAGSEGLRDGVRFMDLFMTRLAMNSAAPVSDGQPVLVYINGKFWGHCNIRERLNKHYFAAQAGITDEDVVDQIDILNDDGTAANGSAKDYRALSRYMARTDLNDPEALEYVLSQLDVDSLFDYAAYNMICGNRDVSNTRFFRIPGGKWTWTLYDLDTALQSTGAAPVTYFMQSVESKSVVDFDHVPFAALMKVPAMKDKFLRRMSEILMEDFNYAFLTEELDRWHAQMAPFIEQHATRWSFLTMKSWTENVEKMRKRLRERPKEVLEAVQQRFRLSDEDMQGYFGRFLQENSR